MPFVQQPAIPFPNHPATGFSSGHASRRHDPLLYCCAWLSQLLTNSTDCTVKDFIDVILFDFPFERLSDENSQVLFREE